MKIIYKLEMASVVFFAFTTISASGQHKFIGCYARTDGKIWLFPDSTFRFRNAVDMSISWSKGPVIRRMLNK